MGWEGLEDTSTGVKLGSKGYSDDHLNNITRIVDIKNLNGNRIFTNDRSKGSSDSIEINKIVGAITYLKRSGKKKNEFVFEIKRLKSIKPEKVQNISEQTQSACVKVLSPLKKEIRKQFSNDMILPNKAGVLPNISKIERIKAYLSRRLSGQCRRRSNSCISCLAPIKEEPDDLLASPHCPQNKKNICINSSHKKIVKAMRENMRPILQKKLTPA